ncbi:hypothetical protein [Caballeronia sp. AZ10_KS36]|uniref:hypothetical protein n=1 Tax=Caballeronia sp. AZ10_KS36 TaxID=2921757 RepID=UPI002028BC61|nr:hypothetical protein [Caballeronia sp. AZ10_KS36]
MSPDTHPSEVLRRLKQGVASGNIVAISSPRQSRQASGIGPAEQSPRPYYATVTPSQLHRRAAPESLNRSLGRVAQRWEKLPAEDGLAIFRSKPGDVLPDGRIATPLTEGGSMFAGIMMTVAATATADSESNGHSALARSFGDESPLGDASPFEYSDDSSLSDISDVAARGVSEFDEAECYSTYEYELDQCDAVRAMTQNLRALAVCKEHAFLNYQRCRGF